ncbi:MAG: methionyl-tRNA formyltransferase [Dehalococcoidia bacterium]|nr:methionyl-tRNA formyltransferase [Dehalococcoidia bacterium]
MRVVFMGSPDFALPTLRRLIESEHDVVGVVTQPDRPAGRRRHSRPPPAKQVALEHGLPVLQPERVNAPDALHGVRRLEPDAIVIAAYGQILRQPLLDIPRRGLLNVHASLLPAYRGASPVVAALLAGERETGVTILEVVLELDAGPIVTQRSLPIEPNDTAGTLSAKLARLGADLLIEVLPAWERGELTPQPQDGAQASYAPTIRREDAVIDWSLPAVDVWRRVRAYNPWPVATTSVEGEPLRILEASLLEGEPDVPAGTVLPLPEAADAPAGVGFAVRCGRGLLAVVRGQRAGRRALTGEELLRGFRGLLGKRLGS